MTASCAKSFGIRIQWFNPCIMAETVPSPFTHSDRNPRILAETVPSPLIPCKRGQNHPSCYSAPLGTTPQPGQNVRVRANQLLTARSSTRASPLIQHSKFCSTFATETAPSARFPAVHETNQCQPAKENHSSRLGSRPAATSPRRGCHFIHNVPQGASRWCMGLGFEKSAPPEPLTSA